MPGWWAWARRKPDSEAPARADIRRLLDFGQHGVPVEQRIFGQGHLLRPNFIQPYRCRNLLIEGITIRNSPMWEIHPVLSTNVIVRGVRISSHGPNNDGCDPESCRDVLIEDTVTLVVQVNGKKRGEVTVARNAQNPEIEAAVLGLDAVKQALGGKSVRKVIIVPMRIVNVVG